MTYDDDVARLARSLARLVGEGPTAVITPLGIAPALVCRDVLVTSLGGLVQSAVDRGRLTAETRERSVALRDALLGVPLADVSRGRLSLIDALALQGGPELRRWQDVARGAGVLEAYRGLLPPGRCKDVVGHAALLASVLPQLDSDLLQHSLATATRDALGGPPAAAVAAAAEACRWPNGTQAVDITVPFVPRFAVVRRPEHLVGGTEHLAEHLRRRSADLSMVEVRAAVRVLAEGLQAAARHDDRAAQQLAAATPALRTLLTAHVATANPPDQRLVGLAEGLRQQLRAAGALTLGEWHSSAAALARGISAAIGCAAQQGQLLMPHQEESGRARPLWEQLRDRRTPFLRAAAALSAHLNTGPPSVSAQRALRKLGANGQRSPHSEGQVLLELEPLARDATRAPSHRHVRR